MKSILAAFVVIFTGVAISVSNAAVDFTGSYSQYFTSLINTGSDSWANNSTLAGWYSNDTTYKANEFTEPTGGLYSFGDGVNPERALGSFANGAPVYFGIELRNASGGTLSDFTITYRGEQWWRGANSSEKLAFEYFLGNPGSINSGVWTEVPELGFTAVTAGGSAYLNGNVGANGTNISYTITGLNVQNGGSVWFRWRDMDDDGVDAGLAIDDLSIIAPVPEPAEWGLICAAGLLGVCGFHTWCERRHGRGAQGGLYRNSGCFP